MTTTIEIRAQYLTGNAPEGLDHDAWLARLEAEYRTTASARYPNAEVLVTFDRQNASGYQRPAEVSLVVDGEDELDGDLERDIEAAAGYLWDRIGADGALYT